LIKYGLNDIKIENFERSQFKGEWKECDYLDYKLIHYYSNNKRKIKEIVSFIVLIIMVIIVVAITGYLL